nr:hypothetical protein GZ27A8_47 [uncultured archaeon GZfos27A8]
MLHPSELLKLHATPIGVFYMHSRGVVSLRIGCERGKIMADRLIESFAQVSHRLQNVSDSIFRFLTREDAGTLKWVVVILSRIT